MLTSAVPGVSIRERRPVARVGEWLFRHRGYVPLPLLLVLAAAPHHLALGWWGATVVLVAAGETIRVVAVAAAGPETRRRTRTVRRLVTYGVFAWTRNPLYMGNFLAWTGFALLSGQVWFVAVAIVLFIGVYGFIVRYEEAVLESLFGDRYLAYRCCTLRWIPWPPGRVSRGECGGEYCWRAAWMAETSTFAHYVGLAVLLAAKARWSSG